jgi:cbb3-type cytochrome c oxidase subunit II
MRRVISTEGVHRKLEGWPLMFTLLTVLCVLVGGLVEFLPIVLIEGNVPRIASVKPFTPLEQVGRDLYIREGCNNCHSQMVRPFRDEVERYGEYSKPGETVYEHPFLWGSKRTGPDLARVGGKYPHLWHVRHMQDPRSISPNSIMPPYAWMLEDPLHLADLPTRLRALRTLGVPYTDDEIANAVVLAETQARTIAEEVATQGGPANLHDREIVAVVAYLQRLGTDLKAAAPAQAAVLR